MELEIVSKPLLRSFVVLKPLNLQGIGSLHISLREILKPASMLLCKNQI